MKGGQAGREGRCLEGSAGNAAVVEAAHPAANPADSGLSKMGDVRRIRQSTERDDLAGRGG